MPQTAYCYHCHAHHAIDQMRQIETKGGKRLRCIKSIEATKKGPAERVDFGRQTTAINKADAEAVKRRMAKPEQEK